MNRKLNKLTKLQAGLILIVLCLLAGTGLVGAVSPPAPAPAGSTLDQRIAQRKAERGTALSNDDAQRLVSTCAGAQAKLRLIQTGEVAMLQKRTTVYGSIDGKLWVVIGQLKLANQDTFQLIKQRQALADKIAAFQTTAADYKQVIDDALLINCKADPNGFKALVDTARLYHDQLHSQSAEGRDYIINTVKASLKSHITDLQAKSPNGGGN
jgi:hypothetical protein